MSIHTQLILVDPDFRRRAAISHCLSGAGVHVEPFEDLSELSGRWPRSGLILACDEGDLIGALMRHMTATGAWLPVVAFAEGPEPRRIVEAVVDGAVDYMAWPFGADEIVMRMDSALDRAARLGNGRLREAMANSRIQRLTRREREVLSGVASGLSNRLIGAQLSISPRTVEIHRANMLTKIGANHTSEAIRIAVEASLVT